MSPTQCCDEPNLVRGVCVLGMWPQTFPIALGPHAQYVYLQNAQLDAATACYARLVHQLVVGVEATKQHAREMARLTAARVDLVKVMYCERAAIDLKVLVREAIGHAECQLTNGGFAKSQLQTHTSMV